MKTLLLILSPFILGYVISDINDTASFQSFMRYLMIGDTRFNIESWGKNRLFVLPAVLALILLYYTPIFKNYLKLMGIYRNSRTIPRKPSMDVQRANYFFLQKEASSFLVWMITLCQKGVIRLHHTKGMHPWAISLNEKKINVAEADKERLDELFINGKHLILKSLLSSPLPEAQNVSQQLFKEIKNNNVSFMLKRSSRIPAILLFIFMLFEILSVSASYKIPGLIIICLALSLFLGASIYIIISQIQNLFTGNYLIATLVILFAVLMISVSHWGMTGIAGGGFYWELVFFPELAFSLFVFIYTLPLLPKNILNLEQIIGYQKYLSESDLVIEKEIEWRLGLQVGSDLFNKKITYKSNKLPDWLVSDSDDINTTIEALFETFPVSIEEVVNGNVQSRHHKNLASSRSL